MRTCRIIEAIPKKDRSMLASWARSFAAAVLALWLAGVTDPKELAAAGLAAVVPPLLRWLNPADQAFGRGSPR
jgi:hypothetical protein